MRRQLDFLWLWPCLLAITLVCYLPALAGAPVWDDQAHITRPDLRTWDGLRRIWFELGATQQYYPVVHSAFWLEHRLWGDATPGYHLVNVFLHATAAFLFALILKRLWGSAPRAAEAACVGGLLFAVHPVCTESVAWISEQKNTFSTVFYLASGLVYLRYDEGPRTARRYALALVLFVLALLSKSVTATLPAALLVVLWWRRGRLRWREDALPLAPWFVIGAASGLFTAWVERTLIGAEGADFSLSFFQRCLLAGRALWFYVGKLLWPQHLIFVYPRWAASSAGLNWIAYPLAAAAATAALVRLARRQRGPLAAWLFFAGTLFPALGFFNVYPFLFSYVADHFQYLASLGILALLAAGWRLWRSRAPAPAAGAAAAAVCLLGSLTFVQARDYGDIQTLYTATIARNPDCWMAHYNLGILEGQAGHLDNALAQLHETLRIRPAFYPALVNFGDVLLQSGNVAPAIAQYEAALRLQPDGTEANNNLGMVLTKLGRVDEAIARFDTALRKDPHFAPAHYNLGNAYRLEGRTAEAIAQYAEALRIDPDYAAAAMNLGNLLRQTGHLPEAIEKYRLAVRLRPDFAAAHANLAKALFQAGRTEEAREQFAQAAQLSPPPSR